MSQAGLIQAGVGAASEDSSDEYSSPSGDTFSDMILKLLKQMTGGGDVVGINIYNLLHVARLDEFLMDSLRAAMQLDSALAAGERDEERGCGIGRGEPGGLELGFQHLLAWTQPRQYCAQVSV